jgi:hypothetical protein
MVMMSPRRLLACLAALLGAGLRAEVSLPRVFGDNRVLQAGRPVHQVGPGGPPGLALLFHGPSWQPGLP